MTTEQTPAVISISCSHSGDARRAGLRGTVEVDNIGRRAACPCGAPMAEIVFDGEYYLTCSTDLI